ncbi:hypothetical protein [Jiangella asiatica]|uniref:Uncharacterized protein n=1 Tax=Jiangella asiatica TaxID=2530372 RepID=A0A4R5CM80_9ACTN|nr:hypothetical protein [Jiangella asiatica]TDE00330.1 hypothetical protein E1269_25760 [Jiangella asiatica]
MTRQLDRRAFLRATLGGGLTAGTILMAACGTEEPLESRAVRSPETAPKQPGGVLAGSDHLAPVPDLPAPQPWTPAAGEISPEIKLAAVQVIEALGAAPDPAEASRRLADLGAAPSLVASAGPLVPTATPSVVTVVYPQYGGLERATACVMAVAEQTWIADRELDSRSVTVDVRLTKGPDGWTVKELRPVAAVDRAALPLTGPAAELAGGGRVHLPDAAVADLAAGRVDSRVVAALTTLSRTYELSVSVFRSGHPENVFGTDRTSNHTRGRAVDIWAVDGAPVASMARHDPRLSEFLAAVRATGSDEIGGPIDPDGPGGDHFADDLHRDHVHLGFER